MEGLSRYLAEHIYLFDQLPKFPARVQSLAGCSTASLDKPPGARDSQIGGGGDEGISRDLFFCQIVLVAPMMLSVVTLLFREAKNSPLAWYRSLA